MTTIYRDKEGKHIRTEPGTRPRGATPLPPAKFEPESPFEPLTPKPRHTFTPDAATRGEPKE